jgi:hypothetical protein
MGMSFSHAKGFYNYRAFGEMRRELALAAGFPPLEMMDGYLKKEVRVPINGESVTVSPIKWDLFESDPICLLLMARDAQGSIPCDQCLAVAQRLEELLDRMPTKYRAFGDNLHQDVLEIFINGLRAAAKDKADFTWS